MKRLTITPDACVETLALLITMAWADGRLEEAEKAGIRAAAGVFNLTKELRDRLEQLLSKPMPVEELLVESLSARDRAFAFVAAAWMSRIDEDVDPEEQKLLDKVAEIFELTTAKKTDLVRIARDLPPRKDQAWTEDIVTLFRAITRRLEGSDDSVEVAFG